MDGVGASDVVMRLIPALEPRRGPVVSPRGYFPLAGCKAARGLAAREFVVSVAATWVVGVLRPTPPATATVGGGWGRWCREISCGAVTLMACPNPCAGATERASDAAGRISPTVVAGAVLEAEVRRFEFSMGLGVRGCLNQPGGVGGLCRRDRDIPCIGRRACRPA